IVQSSTASPWKLAARSGVDGNGERFLAHFPLTLAVAVVARPVRGLPGGSRGKSGVAQLGIDELVSRVNAHERSQHQIGGVRGQARQQPQLALSSMAIADL